jgi:hypothetical protein
MLSTNDRSLKPRWRQGEGTFCDSGLNFIKDLINVNGKIVEFRDLGLDGKEWFKWNGITQCIKQNRKNNPNSIQFYSLNDDQHIEGHEIYRRS